MEVVFLIGIVQAIFLAILVIFKKNKNLADKILICWLLFMGLHLFSYYLHTIGIIKNYPIAEAFTASFPMLEGAFTFVYTNVITSKIQKFRWTYLIHLSHYVIFTLLLFFVVFTNELPANMMVLKLKNHPNLLITFLGFFNTFLGPIYILSSIIRLNRHKINISACLYNNSTTGSHTR